MRETLMEGISSPALISRSGAMNTRGEAGTEPLPTPVSADRDAADNQISVTTCVRIS